MHIKPKFIHSEEFTGEVAITDYCLCFDEGGPLCHLNIYWGGIVHFCKTLDVAQDHAKQSTARALSSALQDDPEMSFILSSELEHAALAEDTLAKATIFLVLCGFKEFALKALYRCLKDARPLPSRGSYKHIQNTFVERGFWPTRREYFSSDSYDTIRNNFAHGDWDSMQANLPGIDLHDEFGEMAGFVLEIQTLMGARGLSV